MSAFVARSDILSWGRTPRIRVRMARPSYHDEVKKIIEIGSGEPNKLLASGLRRSYGDSCINDAGAMVDMTGLDRFISFDPTSRILVAEAGVSFNEMLKTIVPAGYFLPVTPGTKFVTLGGAIANDVHGKNHHRAGTIGRWIRKLDLLRSDGVERSLAPDDTTGLFAATVGGLGLTGIITRAAVELIPIASSNMDVQTIRFGNLREFFEIATASEMTHDYTVAWIDCLASGARLGRGIFTRASHNPNGNLGVHSRVHPTLPFDVPGFLLNRWSLSAFNELYYRLAGRPRDTTISYEPFFYPLDAIGNWNRFYGPRGFYQYQSVVPSGTAEGATAAMLRAIAEAAEGSFLAVLKTFGNVPSPGLLSFPKKGTTLALDFANRGRTTFALLDKLDAIVREAGGRLYPAKDGRLSKAMFEAGYPALAQFKTHIDPGMSSTFWRRMI